MMADSGARGSAAQIRQLAGMRGLMAKPDGSIIETPITTNFREGLNVLQYFISTHGARKGLADTALKTANSGYLTRRLVDVTQDLVVTEDDCGTTQRLRHEGAGRRRRSGRGPARTHPRPRRRDRRLHPENPGRALRPATLLDEDAVDSIEALGIDEVRVRTPLSCDTRYGLCAKCYGRDLGRGDLVNVGEAVGVIAAQSIGEPGTQLTMRTFHVGGAASRAAAEPGRGQEGRRRCASRATMRYVTNAKGEKVVISRSGEVIITDDNGRERERHKVPYGAMLIGEDGQVDQGRHVLANWDPQTRPIITEFAGRAKFENVEEGVTVAKQIDDVTGLSTLVVIDPKRAAVAAKGVRPQVKLLDEAGQEVKIPGTDHSVTITFQVGSMITVKDGQDGRRRRRAGAHPAGDGRRRATSPAVCRAWRSSSKPARPRTPACWRKSPARSSFGKDTKGKQRLLITEPDGSAHEYLIPKDKHVMAHDGQVVNKGEIIVDGPADPHDILRLQGIEELARYIIDEVQDVYRLQGVKINDKHIEVIVRQMLRRVVSRRSGRFAASSRGAGRALRRCWTRTTSWSPKASVRPTLPVHAARHHQGQPVDRLVHLRGVLPGDDARADRGGDHGQARRTARPQGKRHRRPPRSRPARAWPTTVRDACNRSATGCGGGSASICRRPKKAIVAGEGQLSGDAVNEMSAEDVQAGARHLTRSL